MRNFNELIGLIIGISYDRVINNFEIAKLSSWIKKNRNFSYDPKQAHLISLLDQVLEDDIVTAEESQMLLDYCSQYESFINGLFAKVSELVGIIEGIICDNEINEKELLCFKEWMDLNTDLIREYKPSKIVYDNIDQIIKDETINRDQAMILDMMETIINQTQLETKISYLKNCVREGKNIGIELIALLDSFDAIDIIHNRAENELAVALNSYSGTHFQDPEIIFISLVLIGMLHYDGAFYESVRNTYRKLYRGYSEQKIEGLIRTLLNQYRTIFKVIDKKSRIINVVLSQAIVPSYYLGSFFDFVYDIYKINFDSTIPNDLYEQFSFVFDGLKNVMSPETDEISVNVTKKTYKLIKSTKQLITNHMYNDAIIKLSIIVVRLIDKYICEGKNILFNPYLKRGYEQWISTVDKKRDKVARYKIETMRSQWEPEYILNGNDVYLVTPIHRVKSVYDYRTIRIIIKDSDNVIYDNIVDDIREIVGGYQIMSEKILLNDPLGEIVYQLVSETDVIYDSKKKMYRDFIVFDEQGNELSNNNNYLGTAIFCTRFKVDKLQLFFTGQTYHLSYHNTNMDDFVVIEDKIFNFSELIHPGIFGERYDSTFLSKDDERFDVYKNEILVVFESELKDANFEIKINNLSYKIDNFEYSVVNRKGVNKYTIKIDSLDSGIYFLKINTLKAGKKMVILRTKFAIDRSLFVEQVQNSSETYIVSVKSDLLESDIFDEININEFKEDWIRFQWRGSHFTYYITFDLPVYRIDKGMWRTFNQELWVGDITQNSKIEFYGVKYTGISIVTSENTIIEEIPNLKNEGIFQNLSVGFLLSYSSIYDYVKIELYLEDQSKATIICYNKCILDESKTSVLYNHDEEALTVRSYFYGQGNIRFRIIDDMNNVVFTSSKLKKDGLEYVYNLLSFVNYKVIFFEKKVGLSLKKEHILSEYPIVFYNRKDFVGKSFKIKEVYYDQLVRGFFLRKKHYFNTTYVYFKEMKSGKEFIGEVYVRTRNGCFTLDNINPVNIEICSDVIDDLIELAITKEGDGLLLDFAHHGIMNSIDDDKAVDIYSYNIDMKGIG